MTRMVILTATLITAVLALASMAAADVPQMINYQGQLTDGTGAPLDTTVSIGFAIYDDSTGGASKWSESHPSVTVDSGTFSVVLGTTMPIDDSVFSQPDRWLGITVGGDPELTPRTRLTSAPYTYRAATVRGFSPGPNNIDSGLYTFIAGDSNTVLVDYGSIGGGFGNTVQASDFPDTIIDTSGSRIEVVYDVNIPMREGPPYTSCPPPPSNCPANIPAGAFNTVGNGCFIGGGSYNNAIFAYSIVVGGYCNWADGWLSFIGGGLHNWTKSTGTALAQTIGGGGYNKADGMASTVGGGGYNYSLGDFSTIGGGLQNETGWQGRSTVGGGAYNIAWMWASTVGGGSNNTAGGVGATVSGGGWNTASGTGTGYYSAIGGGVYNEVQADYATIAGGGWSTQGNSATSNAVYGDYGTIGGGGDNKMGIAGIPTAITYATISGGGSNQISAHYGAIGGGISNKISGSYATIGGGSSNKIYDSYATIGGGFFNNDSAAYTTVGGGYSNYVRFGGEYGTIGGGQYNDASGHHSTIGGGDSNVVNGDFGTIGGGDSNLVNGDFGTIGGGDSNTVMQDLGSIGGGRENRTGGDYATIGGGDSNWVESYYGTIAGGDDNLVELDAWWGTVAGGHRNTVHDTGGAIVGGLLNSTYGLRNFIGGGKENTTRQSFATVPGGKGNLADGHCSFAAGEHAEVRYDNSFVWNDGSVIPYVSSAANQFLINASGSVGINLPSLTAPSSSVADLDIQRTAKLRNMPAPIGGEDYVYVDATGVLRRGAAVSSRKYKENIRTLEIEPQQALQLEPVRFQWKATAAEDIGLIAEDVDQVIPELVVYDSEGRPNGVRYDKVPLYLLSTLKNQQTQIEDLKVQLSNQQHKKTAEIETLKTQMAQMKVHIETILAQQSGSNKGNDELAVSKQR